MATLLLTRLSYVHSILYILFVCDLVNRKSKFFLLIYQKSLINKIKILFLSVSYYFHTSMK